MYYYNMPTSGYTGILHQISIQYAQNPDRRSKVKSKMTWSLSLKGGVGKPIINSALMVTVSENNIISV